MVHTTLRYLKIEVHIMVNKVALLNLRLVLQSCSTSSTNVPLECPSAMPRGEKHGMTIVLRRRGPTLIDNNLGRNQVEPWHETRLNGVIKTLSPAHFIFTRPSTQSHYFRRYLISFRAIRAWTAYV